MGARPWFLGVGVAGCVALALDLVPLPQLIEPGHFTSALIGAEVALAAVSAASTVW
jgi:hypothetical protein